MVKKAPTIKLFVEGGGRGKDLSARCREGFQEFIRKAGIELKPRVVACGPRNDAYKNYCTAIDNGELADPEEVIEASPWAERFVRELRKKMVA